MELPVIDFIQARLAEVDPNFETRAGSAHYDMFVIPQQFMLQPLNDFMAGRRIAQSVRQMLAQDEIDVPTTFVSEDVDDIASNVYVTRSPGGVAATTVRVFYITPKDFEFPALTAQFTAGDLNFFNSTDVRMTAAQMTLQSDGSLFYIDVPVRAEEAGSAYNVAAGDISAFLNDTDAVRVTNLFDAIGGLPTETNTQLLDRIPNSIGVRDLETGKGISAILNDRFPFLQQIISIGMGDPEMQRDIVYNTHTGSRTDVYLKTPTLTQGQFLARGLVPDLTRDLPRHLRKELARNVADPVFPSATGTTDISNGTVVVRDSVIEEAATVEGVSFAGSTVDLSTTPWVRMSLDEGTPIQFRISGSTPSSTRLTEIIAIINATFGKMIARRIGNKIRLTSPTIGAGSSIGFHPLLAPLNPSMNASLVVFDLDSTSNSIIVDGVASTIYTEGIDYEVNYEDGLVYQTSFDGDTRDPEHTNRETITSGQIMIDEATTGSIEEDDGDFYLDDSNANAFDSKPLVYVRPGDIVTIVEANEDIGIDLPSNFTVAEVVSPSRISLTGFNPTGTASTVKYSITSTQVVEVFYSFHPISVDIGDQTILQSGSRGVRPGREEFTIRDLPFARILSIQQVDPDTEEPIGDPLVPQSGYGSGGYGSGGYGIGAGGDYRLVVNRPTERFSMYEDSIIVFNEEALSLSYLITYLYNPELSAIHDLTRSDFERVTGADVLVKSIMPAFVDTTIGIRRDPSNDTPLSNEELAQLVRNYVRTTLTPDGVEASDIIKILEDAGVKSVRTPFTMRATILCPDGTTAVYESEDILQVPEIELESQTDNFMTRRVIGWWDSDIVVEEVD